MAEGAFTSGGMVSNLSALLVAREHALPGSRRRGLGSARHAVYCSSEAHHSVIRAVEAAGLGLGTAAGCAIDERRRMRIEALERRDRRRPSTRASSPVAIVANGGTTLTGAVDPLAAIAEIGERRGDLDARRRRLRAACGGEQQPPARSLRGSSAPTRSRSTCTSGSACRRAAARCSSATRARSRPAFGHQESYLSRDEDELRTRSSARSSTRGRSLAPALDGLPRARSRLRSGSGSSTPSSLARRVRRRWSRRSTTLELLAEPTLSTICFRHFRTRPVAKPTSMRHNARLARGDPARRARLPRPGRGRRPHLSARLLRQLPHPDSESSNGSGRPSRPWGNPLPGPRTAAFRVVGRSGISRPPGQGGWRARA